MGDSLGNVVQGQNSTLPVTLEEMIYHTKLVRRATKTSLLVADLPFLSYQASLEQGILACGRLVKEAGAQAVKLEGSFELAPLIQALVAMGVPVMAHIGMKPQSVNLYGGFGKQGKDLASHNKMLAEAKALVEAGAFGLLLENIPHDLAAEITSATPAITIGIGAGGETDGQVQVFHDLFGLFDDYSPRHAVPFGQLGKEMKAMAQAYTQAVRDKKLVSK